jgi:hypothetical protein
MTYDRLTLVRTPPANREWLRVNSYLIRATYIGLLFGLFGCLIGCGSDDWGYVEGVVTLEGQPVGPGTLIFEPVGVDRRSGPSAVGHLDAQGAYTLGAGKKKGAAVGEYRVTIMGGDSDSFAEEMTTKAEAKTLIPARYQSPEAGLTANVAAGKQVINFELTKQNKRRRR